MKTNELAQHLMSKQKRLDFSEPALLLKRQDDFAMRQKILGLSSSQATVMGIGRNELHYLRKKAKSEKPFRVYGKVKERLSFYV